MKKYFAPAICILSLATVARAQTTVTVEPTKANYLRIAAEVEAQP